MSLYSNYEQSLVGRRVQHFRCEAETRLDFVPRGFQQAAGLAAFYDDNTWYYLCVTRDPDHGKILRLVASDMRRQNEPVDPFRLGHGPVDLRATLDHDKLRFAWRQDGEEWTEVKAVLDASKLSDDYGPRYRFTGAFFVLCAQDVTTFRTPADFDYFRYSEL
jgi:xylan 1,4-beta-xylosidase